MNIFRRYTIKSLKKNRTRTIVTIIGIILSVAMITAVTTTVSSMQDFMLRIVENNTGSWHGVFHGLSEERAGELRKKKEIDKYGELQNVGYAKLKGSQNQYKPFLYIGAYAGDYEKLRPVRLIEGRMPQNSTEIILPKFLQENGGFQYKTGDMLTLDVGVRKSADGKSLWQMDILDDSFGANEKFQSAGKQTYHVVGIYNGVGSNNGMSPGYAALTKSDQNITPQGETLYITLQEPDNMNEFMKKNKKGAAKTDINSSYLTYSGHSQSDATKEVMERLMIILIGIIMFGSIALIYNSFSISVTERKKQYGLLSSIGATRKQMKRSVMFESVVLSAIGIPLGVLAGLGGMAVTFYFISDIFERFFTNDSGGIVLQLSASLVSIVIAVVVGFVTVLISAYLPARKALKISAIEAIRQADDIKLKPRKLKTSHIVQKLFGLEGMLASKNFKRNKRKYRATVFSLFISIVLFISASSFCDYMSKSLSIAMVGYDCDLLYTTEDLDKGQKLYDGMKKVKGVTSSSCSVIGFDLNLVVEKNQLTDSYIDKSLDLNSQKDKNGKVPMDVLVVFLDETFYENYLDKNGFDKSIYMDKEKPTAIAVNQMRRFVGSMGKYEVYHAFDKKQFDGKLLFQKKLPKGYEIDPYIEEKLDKNGNPMFTAVQYEWEPTGDGGMNGNLVEGSEKEMTMNEAFDITDIRVGGITDEIPSMAEIYAGQHPMLLYPRGAMEKICKGTKDFEVSMNFDSEQPKESYNEMRTFLQNNNMSVDKLQNIDEMYQSQNALLTLVRVFSFGFIILITMIAMANVFNTISTNVSLRRREFAMLRSVGMTQKGFYKMMNFECLLYGVKGVMYGVPVAIGVTALIYWGISAGIDQDFYVPWYSVAIAVGSVFVVVFATMLYSMGKVRKDNVVETLKNENY